MFGLPNKRSFRVGIDTSGTVLEWDAGGVMMTKRYREAIEVTLADGRAQYPQARNRNGGPDDTVPAAFRWRDRDYEVVRVLGHWREDAGWWRRTGGHAIRIEQADLWRVEARNGTPRTGGDLGAVYELVRRGGDWRLDRIWD